MENCKKCGAIISPGFIYCGRCGTPVNDTKEVKPDIKTKKSRFLKKAGIILRTSSAANIILTILLTALCVFSVYSLIRLIYSLRASAPALDGFISQLKLKFAYVREGLSISYVAKELEYIVTYSLDWIYLGLSIFGVLFSAFNITCCISRLVYLIKNKNTAIRPVRLNRVQAGVFRISFWILIITLLIVLCGYIFMSWI